MPLFSPWIRSCLPLNNLAGSKKPGPIILENEGQALSSFPRRKALSYLSTGLYLRVDRRCWSIKDDLGLQLTSDSLKSRSTKEKAVRFQRYRAREHKPGLQDFSRIYTAPVPQTGGSPLNLWSPPFLPWPKGRPQLSLELPFPFSSGRGLGKKP